MSSREEKLSFARERKIHTFFYYALNCQIDKKLELKKIINRDHTALQMSLICLNYMRDESV